MKLHEMYRIIFTVLISLTVFLTIARTTYAGSVFATAFPSTVVVLPVWPAQDRNLDEPEGSGVVIRAGGYIATAAHVLNKATEVSVRLEDGRVLPARVLGADSFTDIAVLKIDASPPPFTIGPAPELGARVCTIGNQFGLGLSLTCGVASAVNRSGVGFNRIEDFLQTDAALNPGSSGGAIIDRQARLVGMISAIFTKQSDGDIGVNFAVSTRLLTRVADDIIQYGSVQRAKAGLRFERVSNRQPKTYTGAKIAQVFPNGNAARAGLLASDIITHVGSRAVQTPTEVLRELYMFRPGETVSVQIVRDGAKKTVPVPLR